MNEDHRPARAATVAGATDSEAKGMSTIIERITSAHARVLQHAGKRTRPWRRLGSS